MLTKEEYGRISARCAPRSSTAADCLKAFLTGGSICLLGQIILTAFTALGLDEENAKTLTSVSLVALGITLTAIGVYDKIARFGGAGTLVPITGFANAVSSAAIEFKSEGFITGVGAKIFTIAGPVIVYGTTAATLYGTIYYLIGLFSGK